MKKNLLASLLMTMFFFACTTSKTYIDIKQPEDIYYGGKIVYSVDNGDKLEVLKKQTCRDGIGTCYQIKNLGTNKIGYVRESTMQKRHRVYLE